MNGYSPVSIFHAIKEQDPINDTKPGHRVLVMDMPPEIWVTHFEIFSLPIDLIGALIGRYCVPPRDEDGRMFTKSEIAKALRCHRTTYMRRLGRARNALIGSRQTLATIAYAHVAA